MANKRNVIESSAVKLIAERLALVREVEGLSQSEFAGRAGINGNAWNNYERARKRISIDAAIRLVEAYNLTLDYIYLGDASNLPYQLASALEAVKKQRDTRS